MDTPREEELIRVFNPLFIEIPSDNEEDISEDSPATYPSSEEISELQEGRATNELWEELTDSSTDSDTESSETDSSLDDISSYDGTDWESEELFSMDDLHAEYHVSEEDKC